jgi:cytochrome c peroxidase
MRKLCSALVASSARSVRAASVTLGVLASGCFGPVHGYEPDEGTEFTTTDLAIIRRELGSLPAQPPADPSNQYADDRDAAVLGQMLFFETRYSQNGMLSCATCHDPTTGFQDRRSNTSQGLAFTGRHSSTLFNVGYGSGRTGATDWQFWDGRKDSLWSQALGPPESDVEMGGTRSKLALLLYDKYHAAYRALFGEMPVLRDAAGNALVSESAHPAMPGDPETADTRAWDALPDDLKTGITEVYVNFGKAMAAYERLLVSRDSRFDAFYAEIAAGASRSKQLDAEEAEGLKVFIGNGKCISCHLGPNFSDWKFHNIGVAQEGQNVFMTDDGREDGLALVVNDPFNCASAYSDRPDKDGCAVNSIDLDPNATADFAGAFKTPGLRSVSQTAPYFHTGGEESLDDVVDHYDEGGDGDGFLGHVDPNIVPLHLTDEEKSALVAFLKTLDGVPLPSSLTTAPPLPP